jgi:chromate reductase, NAD(P)H dehydrogenase (quinone)
MSDATVIVLAIPGSLRRGSSSRALLEAAASAAPEGVEVTIWEGLRDVPPYDQDDDTGDGPAPVAALRAAIGAADAVLISTPEYNHSIPGVLKNAIDWASRPFGLATLVGTPTAVISSSTSPFGGVWANAELRKSLAAAGARVLDEHLTVPKVDSLRDADGLMVDQPTIDRLVGLVEELRAAVHDPVLVDG